VLKTTPWRSQQRQIARRGNTWCPVGRAIAIADAMPGSTSSGMREQLTSAATQGRARVRHRDEANETPVPVQTALLQRIPAGRSPLLGPSGVLALQRAAGNRAAGTLLVPGADGRMPVQRDGDSPTVDAPLRRGIRLLPPPIWLSEPGNFLSDKPSLIPPGGLTLLPPAGVEGLIDWGGVGTAYQDRRLVLEDRDRSLIVGHWQRWYPVAQGLYKLPLAKSLFDSPAAIMNTMTAKMIDSSLAGDRPNMMEMFDRQAQQFGVKTTTVSVTVKRF
jgi:hypothetical protein